jgi:hypothetical protein
MAVLIVELHGIKRGSVLPRRVLIGRRSMNQLVIDDPGVSRMHAWIVGEGDRFYINDTGSRTGTQVNGQRIVARHLLGDEDEIAIGPAKLTFLAESRLRPGVQPIDLASPPKIAASENGILFDCPSCTAPLWATHDFAGGTGQCNYCGRDLVVPGHRTATKSQAAAKAHAATTIRTAPSRPAVPIASPVSRVGSGASPAPSGRALTARPGDRVNGNGVDRPATLVQAAPPARPVRPEKPSPANTPAGPLGREGEQICGVCHSGISVFEDQASCPSCGLIFHADCWAENHGCSAYGCPQVNALAPPAEADQSTAAVSQDADGNAKPAGAESMDEPPRFPWEFLLLAGSVFSALVGALTFGLPSLALAGGTVAYMARTRGSDSAHRGIVMLSAALALLGVIAGIPVSWFLYFGGPHS